MRRRARALVILATLLGTFAAAPDALATISPGGLSIDESAGTQAGSTVALTTAINFTSGGTPASSSDSVKNLTLAMPPGLLANAAIDGGACLATSPASNESAMPTACRVGTGQVTATSLGLGVNLNISLYLVAPPAAGDLAGLAVYADVNGSQLGDTGSVAVRPADAGLSIALTNIPSTFQGIQIFVKQLQTTLGSVRLPTRCPSLTYAVSAVDYSGARSQASAPLQVTGCGSLTFAGSTFSATATRDGGDAGTAVTTDITQPANANEATSGTSILKLPADVLVPNVAAVVNGGILCADPTSGTCKPVGTATTTSPLYPKPLTGTAYLTGSLASQSLTLVFPPPFPFTLTGKVTLPSPGDNTITTTFSGLPDLPLTDLQVALAGGSNALFDATCQPASGSASAVLASQDGGVTAPLSTPIAVTGCPTAPPVAAPPPSPSKSPNRRPGPPPRAPGRPVVTGAAFNGLRIGHPLLRLRVSAGRAAPALASVTVVLPGGVRALRGRIHVSASGARVRSVRTVHGRLLVTFRRPARAVRLVVRGLAESRGLRTTARRRHLHRLRLVVCATDGSHRTTRLPYAVRHLGL